MTFDDVKRSFQVREGYWFVPKLFGFGATPVTWQGWALTFALAAAILLDMRYVAAVAPKLVIGLALTATFVTIAWRKTDGGWHWRWGPRG
jgi:hypothetical protein